MKGTLVVLAAAAGFNQASATFLNLGNSFLNAKIYTPPQAVRNVCDRKQESGWNFDDAKPGYTPQYGNMSLDGFQTETAAMARRGTVESRTLGKFLSAICGPEKEENPSISAPDGKYFSIDSMEISTECPNSRIELHYDMPDGRICKMSHTCGSGLTNIKNTQCGGAKKVTFFTPKQEILQRLKCKIKVYKVIWNCKINPKPTLPIVTTTIKSTLISSTTRVSSTRVSSILTNSSAPVSSTPVSSTTGPGLSTTGPSSTGPGPSSTGPSSTGPGPSTTGPSTCLITTSVPVTCSPEIVSKVTECAKVPSGSITVVPTTTSASGTLCQTTPPTTTSPGPITTCLITTTVGPSKVTQTASGTDCQTTPPTTTSPGPTTCLITITPTILDKAGSATPIIRTASGTDCSRPSSSGPPTIITEPTSRGPTTCLITRTITAADGTMATAVTETASGTYCSRPSSSAPPTIITEPTRGPTTCLITTIGPSKVTQTASGTDCQTVSPTSQTSGTSNPSGTTTTPVVTSTPVMPTCVITTRTTITKSGGSTVTEAVVPASGTFCPTTGTLSGTVVTFTSSGTVVSPSGTVVTSSGTVVSPSGTVVIFTSSGTVITSSSTVVSPSGTTNPSLSQTGTNTGPDPTSSMPYPSMVPSCLNTFLALKVKECQHNMDTRCYCPSKPFIDEVYKCVYAHGENDNDVKLAISFIQGICRPWIPVNPGIATLADNITSIITVIGTPTMSSVQYTTAMVTNMVSDGTTTKMLSSELAVPDIQLPTAGPVVPTGTGSTMPDQTPGASGTEMSGAPTVTPASEVGTGVVTKPTTTGGGGVGSVISGASRMGSTSLGLGIAIIAAIVAL